MCIRDSRSFVPQINAWGKLVIKTRYVLPPVFAILLVLGFCFSNQCPYVYGESNLHTYTKNESQIAQEDVYKRQEVELHVADIDLIPEAVELARMGLLPAGMYRNRSFAEARVDPGTTELCRQDLLYDPQTRKIRFPP